jgi:hypothetical protein
MQFMTVYTYPPERRGEVIKQRSEKGDLIPEGMKLLGEWSYTGSGKVFRLVEANDPAVMVKAMAPWANLGHIETYPVMETDKLMALLKPK